MPPDFSPLGYLGEHSTPSSSYQSPAMPRLEQTLAGGLSRMGLPVVFKRACPFVLLPKGHMANQSPPEQEKFLRSSLKWCFCSLSGHTLLTWSVYKIPYSSSEWPGFREQSQVEHENCSGAQRAGGICQQVTSQESGPQMLCGGSQGLLSGLSDEVRLGEYAKMCRTIKLQTPLPDHKSLGMLSTYRVWDPKREKASFLLRKADRVNTLPPLFSCSLSALIHIPPAYPFFLPGITYRQTGPKLFWKRAVGLIFWDVAEERPSLKRFQNSINGAEQK